MTNTIIYLRSNNNTNLLSLRRSGFGYVTSISHFGKRGYDVFPFFHEHRFAAPAHPNFAFKYSNHVMCY